MTRQATVYEVGPRDGLQNETALISTDDKIRLVDMLSDTGLSKIEVTSFVSPKWVPQMADGAEVMAGIKRRSGVTYAALTPNLRGFEAALGADTKEIAVFASASDGFSQNNINCSVAESLERFRPVVTAARDANVAVRGYVSCIAECPFDGTVPPHQVVEVSKALWDMGCYQVSLGDTTGRATPEQIDAVLKALANEVPSHALAGHFHDSFGRALENVDVGLENRLCCFDAAVGGLGGCPYAPGAPGNVATEAVVRHLEDKGIATGVDQALLADAAAFALTLKRAS
jgi:hydroxymethylglutaryl-CoA lyase